MLHLLRRPAAALPGVGVRPQGRPAAAWPASSSARASTAAFFGAFDPADAVVVTASGSSTALPGTEAGRVKVDTVQRVPRQGPRDRRRAQPPLPQGRGHPRHRVGRAGPGAGRRGQRCTDRPARGRPAGATAPATPAPQPIAAVASPVAAQVAPGRGQPVRDRLWKAEAMSRPDVPQPWRPPPCSSCPPSPALLGRLVGGGHGRGVPRRGPGARLGEADRDQRGRAHPGHRRPSRGGRRHRQGGRHRHRRTRPSRAPSRSSSPVRPPTSR